LENIMKAVVGALLHDIGKVVQRAGGLSGTHSKIGADYLGNMGINDPDIIDCVKFHHGRALATAEGVSDYAYVAYIADNIAAATERREAPDESAQSGWDSKMPLQSVFNLLVDSYVSNSQSIKSERYFYRPVTLDSKEGFCFPQTDVPKFDEHFYGNIVNKLTDSLKGFTISSAYASSLLELTEATLSFVPSSTSKEEVADISLYDHMKLTAAISGCIYAYLQEKGETDYKQVLLQQAEKFYDEDFAILYSADISGIQNFIYTIHSANALKTLRARSFYLELFMDNLIDEVLDATGLTRANLIYSGGGHFYMLLPNTQEVKQRLDSVIAKTNVWLLEHFRNALYVADGYCPCSANDLKNEPTGAYAAIFKNAGRAISEKKLHRYSASDIRKLNNRHADGRECRICKSLGNHDDDDTCALCSSFIDLSGSILKQYENEEEDVFFAITRDVTNRSVPIMDGLFATAIKKQDLLRRLATDDDLVRYYGKNAFYTGKHLSTRLWVGDYCKEKELSKYAQEDDGFSRIGVLRMDVDNLGAAFVSGFATDDGKYNTLTRTATLSRHLSMFFKRDINKLLLDEKSAVTIVYSGGDDMFLLGSWDDIIESAVKISDAFNRYTQGKLTVSAGIGVYPMKYPVHIMARETGELEDYAKGKRQTGEEKNAIVLFAPEFRFSWDELKQVREEKLAVLESFFGTNREKGNAFLYQLLAYIRDAESEQKDGRAKISLARYAYLLARAEPDNDESRGQYRRFSEKMYKWVSEDEERRQLKAAIHLYVYSKRGGSDGHN